MAPQSLLLAALLLAPLALSAQDTLKPVETFPKVKITGQIRERTELDDRRFWFSAPTDVVHYLRTRLGAAVSISPDVSATIELQDARLFGEKGTVQNTGAPMLDLRQAFVEVRNIAGAPVSARLGRQAVGYANERLIGRVDWINPAPSFDGIVTTIGTGEFTVDVMGFAIARYANVRDNFLTGAWAAWKPKDGPVNVQGFYLFDTPRLDTITQNRHTTGIYSGGAFDGFDYELDAALQFGDYKTPTPWIDSLQPAPGPRVRDIAASLIGVRAGYTFKDLLGLRIGVGFDRLSGNDPNDATKYGAFNTLYATNHKYYGFMDYFLNIPAHTGGRGLQDIIAQVAFSPVKDLRFAADLHLFSFAIDPTDINPVGGEKNIGNEIDLTLTYRLVPAVTLTGGFSMFNADVNRLVLRGDKPDASWGYLMVAAGF